MRPPSLARRIIITLLIYQTVASLLGATLSLTLDWLRSDTRFAGVEHAVQTVAAALHRTDGGHFTVEKTRALARLADRHPGFWYAVHDGTTTLWGGATAPITADHPVFAQGVEAMGLTDAATGARIYATRPQTIPGQRPLIVVGNVSSGWSNFFATLLGLLYEVVTYVVLPLTLGAALIIRWVMRRVLVGVESAATAAAAVQPTAIGRRIPELDVPREIFPLVKAFNAALSRLDEGHSRQRRFIADAAHELRTPIAILSTRLDMLPDGAAKKQLQTDVRRLSLLARQLLETESVRSQSTSHAPLDLVRLAREAAADLAPQALAAGYTIAFESDLSEVIVMADEGNLRRAVFNLIENAIQHGGGQGGITVEVRSPARILVTDEGPGIRPAWRERIFEPFFRGVSSGTGAGLGLSLVQEIARSHRGSLRLLDEDQRGARFELSLPAEADGTGTITGWADHHQAP